MTADALECLERAAFCAKLAEEESDPELKVYLLKLAADWTCVANERVRSELERV
jgi:hypothetical protein